MHIPFPFQSYISIESIIPFLTLPVLGIAPPFTSSHEAGNFPFLTICDLLPSLFSLLNVFWKPSPALSAVSTNSSVSPPGHIHSLCDPASAVSFANLPSIWSPFNTQILSHFLTQNEFLLLSGSWPDLAWLMRPSTSCWSVWLYLRSLSHKHCSPTSLLKFIEHLLCVGSCAGSSTYIISSVPPIGLPVLWPPHGTTSLLFNYELPQQSMALGKQYICPDFVLDLLDLNPDFST